jgi:2-C-methyl-D-erythritol 4-phosphate cytidylyltransferase
MPVADTLRQAADGVFGDTVPRQDLYRMQTPQGFRRAWLEEAHRQAAAADAPPATDDVGLVQRTGRDVHLVEGRRRNFKITTDGDWQMAQRLWAAEGADPHRSPTGP